MCLAICDMNLEHFSSCSMKFYLSNIYSRTIVVLLVKRNSLILYSYFHRTFFVLIFSECVEVSQLSKPTVSDFRTSTIGDL